jgi:hypothetical protein
VVVTVKIATADGVSGKLELPEDDTDDEGGGYKLKDSDR